MTRRRRPRYTGGMAHPLIVLALAAVPLQAQSQAPLSADDCALLLAHPPEHVAPMKGIPLEEAQTLAERAKAECAGQAPGGGGHHDHHARGTLGNYPMARDAGGTSWQPEASGMDGVHRRVGRWALMAHGFLNGGFDHQGGKRGGDAAYTASMFMGSAQRPLGPGELTVRAMGSADPLLSPRGYPLLFQTGESEDGVTPLVDRQHPHDLVMEASAGYSLPLGPGKSAFAYAGLPGEPALGPPVFAHRASGRAMPDAPISHHWLDSTHLSYGVATLGAVLGPFKIDASAFNGREPDHRRLGLEPARFDSRSARLSYNPDPHWSLQVSRGRLVNPEPLEPGVSVDRMTASASFASDVAGRPLAATAAWGRNAHRPGPTLDAFLAETTLRLTKAAELFFRFEQAEKHGLHERHGQEAFSVRKWSAGAARDLFKLASVRYGVGAMASLNRPPSELKHAYGGSPASAFVWVRARLDGNVSR